MQTHAKEGLIAVHTAVFIFGLTALFSKLIHLSALDISMLRSLFSALAIFIYIRVRGESILLGKRRDYLIVLLLGVLLASHWVTYFHAMQIASIAVGAIALYTFPVITVFLEPFFHGQRPHFSDVISALAVLVGIYLMLPNFDLNDHITQGILYGVASAFLFALRNIITGKYFTHYPARHALLYQSIVVALVLLPFIEVPLFEVSTWQWGQLLILGIFFTALPHTLFAHSLLHLKAKTASLIACMQVVYATCFAAIILEEIPGMMTIVGGLVVLCAAMYESYASAQRKAAQN